MTTDRDSHRSRVHFLPVHRHALVDRTEAVRHALAGKPALILLRGTSGSGKSVTAAQISETYVRDNATAAAVWVRFGPGQAGQEQVWSQVLTSLLAAGVLRPGSGAQSLPEGGIPSLDDVIQMLRTRTAPLMIVLDDAQESITPQVEASLVHVLERMNHMVIVITTRRSLSGLVSHKTRMRIPVRKLTTEQLYFSRREVIDLVRLRFPDEKHASALGDGIHTQSGGWPFAVQAFLLDRDGFSASKHAPLDRSGASETFIAETLDAVLSEARPLSRTIAGALALFGEMSDEIIAQALDVPIDDCIEVLQGELPLEHWHDEAGVNWYSLHEIFGEHMRRDMLTNLSEEEQATIASRATHLLREQRPRLAMQAAIIAGEWSLLSDLLVEGSAITLSREQQVVTLSDIPQSVREGYPVIAAFALIHEYAFATGRLSKAISAFKVISSRKLIAQSQQPGFEGLTATLLRMVVSRLVGSEATAIKLAEQVSERILDIDDAELAKYSATLQIGVNQTVVTYLHAGRYTDALVILERMAAWSEHLNPKSHAHATALHAWTLACLGNMKRLPVLIAQCESLRLPVNWHDSYIGVGYRIAAAIYALEQRDDVTARDHLDALETHRSTIEHWPYLACVETLIVESTRGTSAALTTLESNMLVNGKKRWTTDSMRSMMLQLRSRLAWQAGKALPAVRKQGARSVTAIYAALSRGDDAVAGTIASELTEIPHVIENPRLLTEILLLRAKVALRINDAKAATGHARHTTAILHKYDLNLPMRTLPEPTARALQEFAPGLPAGHASAGTLRIIKPLTPAERRTLIAVREHRSIKATAKAMYLSQDTVKSYTKSIYRKLGVNSRDQALLVATEAGLLGDNDSDTD